jgi:hypothetical protein
MTTDKQKLKQYEQHIAKLQKEIYELKGIQFQLVNDLNVVPLVDYSKLLEENHELISRLKRYNLWTGK